MLTIVLLTPAEAAMIALAAFPPRFRLDRPLPDLPEGPPRD
jgi:hypothetical protein